MTRDAALRSAKNSYVRGWIDIDEFERRVEEVLSPEWTPLNVAHRMLREAWALPATDAPGQIIEYSGPPPQYVRIGAQNALQIKGTIRVDG
jgi:hypothetical protein